MNMKAVLIPLFLVAAALSASSKHAPDNTGINERDRQKDELTAGQQGGSTRDREVTQAIRKAIVKDDSLSLNAHNIKIITTDGHVTLKGPVNSMNEKAVVCKAAWKVAGKKFVTDQLDVIKAQ